jgi:hypothetical protein
MKPGQIRPLYLEPWLHMQSVQQEINMLGKAITYKATHKCLADNRIAKYEASVGPA